MIVRESFFIRIASVVAGVALLAGSASAHVGGLSGTTEAGPVPRWLIITTGGVLVGASFLFSTFLTDHAAMRAVSGWQFRIPVPGQARQVATWLLRLLGLAVLIFVTVAGLMGPQMPLANAAILVVWAGWWAGFTMSVYLVGNPWPAINPWAAMARMARPRPQWAYPNWLGVWPSVGGLLALVWLEVVSPVAQDPRLLVGVVAAYTAITLGGVLAFGIGPWFGNVDPIARVFHLYGALAPVHRTDGGLMVAVPSARLVRRAIPEGPGETAFVVALLWVTTFDGLVSTPTWELAIRPAVTAGIPPRLVYFVAIVLGFVVFFWVYLAAAGRARDAAATFISADYLRRWFVPSLIPIAAGYHLAHFLAYFLSLVPVIAAVVMSPVSPPLVEPLVLPDWFGFAQLGFVLGGHLVAIWVAHARAFDLFPGVLTPIRSQYPLIVVMIFYTMTSLWVVAQPFVEAPYV